MRVISTNVGKPRFYEFKGATVQSSMRRQPTAGEIRVYFDRVEGDGFAVPAFHGIKEAVVYAFSAATFAELGRLYTQDVRAGNVGENLTMDELLESEIMVGDEFEIGDVRLRATGPRYPCNRLNFCFQRENAMDLFANYRRPGVYFEVLREGLIRKGDAMKLVKSAGGRLSVLDLFDNLTALKDVVAGKRTRVDVKPIADAMVANLLVPEYIRDRFQKFV
jgi:MOSC domain-containing protein YiiM